MHKPVAAAEARQHPRIRIPAMYTLLRVRPKGDARYRWTGYIYDISQGGMRIELDEALPEGTRVDFRAMLPGHNHATIQATGTVVRMHDEADEPGPMRMGLHIDTFARKIDREKLAEYIDHATHRPHALAA